MARVRSSLMPEAIARLPDHLRATGEYPAIEERAAHKRRVLLASGQTEPGPEDVGLDDEALLCWWCEEEGLPVSAHVDLDAQAREAGFPDARVLLRALAREWCYRNLAGAGSPRAPSSA